MAVSVDTVYQRVLALANKEQRGYITPQEFNLFANQAQMEIFEQYYYDLNKVFQINRGDHGYSGRELEEKIQIFENVDGPDVVSNYESLFGAANVVNKILPSYIYRIHRIELNNVSCEILRTNDFQAIINGGKLTKASAKRPVANIRKNVLRVLGGTDIGPNNEGFALPTGIYYAKKPTKVEWAYVIVNDKPLHNANISVNFELHPSEETELVYKILKFAGVNMKDEAVMSQAQSLEQYKLQREKQ